MGRSTILTSLDEAGLTIGGLEVGKEYHCNHIGCPAGPDSKGRLFVNKREGVGLAWYCHNEGDGGIIDLGYEDRVKQELRVGLKTTNTTVFTKEKGKIGTLIDPAGLLKVTGDFGPTEGDTLAVEFMYKYLGDGWASIATEAGIKYAPIEEAWAYPRGEGWQVRYMNNPTIKARSFGTIDSTLKGVKGYGTRYGSGHIYVFTEDYISATCISRHANCVGVPLFGVHATLRQIAMFIKSTPKSSQFIVWLDNDSDLVRAKATGIGRDLSLLCTEGRKWTVHTGKVEPKKCTRDHRSEILVDHIGRMRECS